MNRPGGQKVKSKGQKAREPMALVKQKLMDVDKIITGFIQSLKRKL